MLGQNSKGIILSHDTKIRSTIYVAVPMSMSTIISLVSLHQNMPPNHTSLRLSLCNRACRRSRSPLFAARSPSNRNLRRHVQIILIPSTTPQLSSTIPRTSKRTRLRARQTSRLRRRCYGSCITFSSIFDTRVEVCCCRGCGETCQGGGDAEVWSHGVVGEEFRHVMAAVGTTGGVGVAACVGETAEGGNCRGGGW